MILRQLLIIVSALLGVNTQPIDENKAVIQEAILFPEPQGVGGESSLFGYAMDVDGNRAAFSFYGYFPNRSAYAFIAERDNNNAWQITQIIHPNEHVHGFFGKSLDLEGDQLIVGAPNYGGSATQTAAYVFALDGQGVWRQSAKIQNENPHLMSVYFGYQVFIQDDQVMVSDMNDDNRKGAVILFERNGSQWVQSQKLTASTSTTEWFGNRFTMSGNQAFIMGQEDVGNRIFEFKKNPQTLIWEEVSYFDYDGFGSIQFDGEQLFLSNYSNDTDATDAGRVLIYHKINNQWTLDHELISPAPIAYEQFGKNFDVRNDILAIGTRNHKPFTTRAYSYIFKKTNNYWTYSHKVINESGDGLVSNNYKGENKLKIFDGGLFFSEPGKQIDGSIESGVVVTHLFDANSSNQDQLITIPGTALDFFGSDVKIAGDYAFVGSIGFDSELFDSGAVYVFKKVNEDWLLHQLIYFNNHLNHYDAASGRNIDVFGPNAEYLAIQGNRCVITFKKNNELWGQLGNPVCQASATAQSISLFSNRLVIGLRGTREVQLYLLDNDSWSFKQNLSPLEDTLASQFGHSVAQNNQYILVGAYNAMVNGVKTGAAHLFENVNDQWLEVKHFTPDDGSDYDLFGWSIDLNEQFAFISAHNQDVLNVTAMGSVYAYSLNNFNSFEKIQNDLGADGDKFGRSISAYGNMLAVGAYAEDSCGYNCGAVYLFEYDNITWSLKQRIVGSNIKPKYLFGERIHLNQNHLIVGTPNSNLNGFSSGVAHIYNTNAPDLIFQSGFEGS